MILLFLVGLYALIAGQVVISRKLPSLTGSRARFFGLSLIIFAVPYRIISSFLFDIIFAKRVPFAYVLRTALDIACLLAIVFVLARVFAKKEEEEGDLSTKEQLKRKPFIARFLFNMVKVGLVLVLSGVFYTQWVIHRHKAQLKEHGILQWTISEESPSMYALAAQTQLLDSISLIEDISIGPEVIFIDFSTARPDHSISLKSGQTIRYKRVEATLGNPELKYTLEFSAKSFENSLTLIETKDEVAIIAVSGPEGSYITKIDKTWNEEKKK